MARAGAAALLAGAGGLCFLRSLRGGFVHDDVWAIVHNPDVRPGAPLRARVFADDFWGRRLADAASHKSYRPLCVLTFQARGGDSGRDTAALDLLLPHTVGWPGPQRRSSSVVTHALSCETQLLNRLRSFSKRIFKSPESWRPEKGEMGKGGHWEWWISSPDTAHRAPAPSPGTKPRHRTPAVIWWQEEKEKEEGSGGGRRPGPPEAVDAGCWHHALRTHGVEARCCGGFPCAAPCGDLRVTEETTQSVAVVLWGSGLWWTPSFPPGPLVLLLQRLFQGGGGAPQPCLSRPGPKHGVPAPCPRFPLAPHSGLGSWLRKARPPRPGLPTSWRACTSAQPWIDSSHQLSQPLP